MSVFRGSLKLKLSSRIDIAVGLFCLKKEFNVLTLLLNLYVLIDYLQSIPSVNFSCHTPPPPTQKFFGTPLALSKGIQKQNMVCLKDLLQGHYYFLCISMHWLGLQKCLGALMHADDSATYTASQGNGINRLECISKFHTGSITAHFQYI